MAEIDERRRLHSFRRLRLTTVPGAIASLSFGYLSAWYVAVHSQPANTRLTFWTPLTIVGAVLVVVGALVWIRGSSILEHERDAKLDGMDKKLDQVVDKVNVVSAGPRLEAARNNEAPRDYGSELTVPAGSLVSAANGVGPVTIVVPSGIPFGIQKNGPVEFSLELAGASITLPEGGTIHASGSASFGLDGHAHGKVN